MDKKQRLVNVLPGHILVLQTAPRVPGASLYETRIPKRLNRIAVIGSAV